MNTIFYSIVVLACVFSLINGTPSEVGQAALEMSKASVDLAIGLVGYMALFLGLMKVIEEAGGLKIMARLIRPVLVRLFPDVPVDHPAMGAMVMNFSAHALGLGNAATPFALKAMQHLNDLNKKRDVASDAMVLFLAINTSGIALFPTTIVAVRALHGSIDPTAIFLTSLVATSCSTLVAITVAKLLAGTRHFALDHQTNIQKVPLHFADVYPFLLFCCFVAGFLGLNYAFGEKVNQWILPGLIIGTLTFGVLRGVRVYDVFVEGAKEGFSLALTIIPYLVAILVAVGMLRASGGLEAIVGLVNPLTALIGMPPETLPLAILRPLSGSGSLGITADLIQVHGPDSQIGLIASTMHGSTETTFYILAVYFGSIGIRRIRHFVWAGVAADITGMIASVLAVKFLLNV